MKYTDQNKFAWKEVFEKRHGDWGKEINAEELEKLYRSFWKLRMIKKNNV
jgi:hypothetical protein